jgi:curved DNA-binding protein
MGNSESTAMEFGDYMVLGVERTASDDEIKKAFVAWPRTTPHHKAPDASARMQDLNEAHEVLRDKEKRAAYDRVGQGAQGGQTFHPPPGWDSGFEFSGGREAFGDAGDHSAFFEALFGAARRGAARGRPGHGADARSARAGPPPRSWRWKTPSGRDARARCTARIDAAATWHCTSALRVSILKGIRAGQQSAWPGRCTRSGRRTARRPLPGDRLAPHPRWRVVGATCTSRCGSHRGKPRRRRW